MAHWGHVNFSGRNSNVRTWKPMSLLLVGAFALAACTSTPGSSTEPSTAESMAPESMTPESMAPEESMDMGGEASITSDAANRRVDLNYLLGVPRAAATHQPRPMPTVRQRSTCACWATRSRRPSWPHSRRASSSSPPSGGGPGFPGRLSFIYR